jgi:DNA (cytosine-5)-methyltransferase 1
MRKILSLYTGMGGLDFGFERAGFDTAVAVEMDHACCATIRANRNWPVIEGDIHEVSTDDILRKAWIKQGEADLLIGGPPCQPFSKSGYWSSGDAKRLDDPRASTLGAYLRVLGEAQPKAFFLENVPGLGFKNKSEGLQSLLDGIAEVNRSHGTNYQPRWAVLNAADYGTPQLRERLVMVASRDGRPFEFPDPTHGDAPTALEPHRTAWDALGDLPPDPNEAGLEMTGKWADLLPSIPEGNNYLWHTERGGGSPLFGWRRRYWNFLLKLAKDRPSWTIQAQPGSATGPFHWRNRKFSVRELCRLQTFPDDVTPAGSRTDAQRMVGNAVPSVFAEVLAREIGRQYFSMEPATPAPTLLPPRRDDNPGPEPVTELPEQFEHLIGEHEAHPGEGKGYAAANRAA